MKQDKNHRHPTRIKSPKPPPSHPPISYGTIERKVLGYVSKMEEYTNKSEIARALKLPRSTFRDCITRLKQKELITQLDDYSLILTTKGEKLIISNNGVLEGGGGLGWGWRKVSLSVHYLRFILPLKNGWKNLSISAINRQELTNYKELKNKNMPQHFLYFKDTTIIINKHQVAIRIHDTLAQDTEEAIFRAMNKAIEFLPMLKSLGLETSEIHLDDPHYARVESLLADSLQKIDKRYFLQLEDGTKFWIDNSGKSTNPEDETNRELARLRVDRFMKQIIEDDIDLTDLNKLKEVVGDLTTFTVKNLFETNKDIKKLITGLNTFIKVSTKRDKPIRYKQDNTIIEYIG